MRLTPVRSLVHRPLNLEAIRQRRERATLVRTRLPTPSHGLGIAAEYGKAVCGESPRVIEFGIESTSMRRNSSIDPEDQTRWLMT